MIEKDGRLYVFIPTINYGDDGGLYMLAVHDTYEGASETLKSEGFRETSTVLGVYGVIYAAKDKTPDEYPYGFIDKMVVRK